MMEILFFIVLLASLLPPSHSTNGIINQPVIWRASTTPITSGFAEVDLTLNLLSPCHVLTNETIHPNLLEESRKRCDDLFNSQILNELKIMCPIKSELIKSRKERELFTLLAILAIAVVSSVGFGVTFYQINQVSSRVNDLKTKQQEAEEFVQEKARELNINKEATNILQRELNNLTSQFVDHVNDYSILKETSVSSSFAISYISSRLVLGQQILQETQRLWKNRKLHQAFFDYLNITNLCNTTTTKADCPIDLGVAKSCSFTKEGIFKMKFTVPIINETLKLVTADPFDFIHQTENATCIIKYTGPTTAIISTIHECVHAVNLKPTDIIISPSDECRPEPPITQNARFFKLDHCQKRHPHDAADFVQIKAFNGMLHIYCNGNNLTIGRTRKLCSHDTFTLPLSSNFYINDHHYKSGTYQISHQEVDNPLWTMKANWYLQPTLHVDDIIDPITPLTPGSTTINHATGWDHSNEFISFNSLIIIIILVVLVVICTVMIYCFCCKKFYRRV